MAITKGQRLKCPECHTVFIKKSYQQIFCQIPCQIKNSNRRSNAWRINTKNCARCNKSLLGKRGNAIYCSRTCKSMDHTFKHRGKTRFATTARRKEIYDRDLRKCYICEMTLGLSEVELDHLVPLSRGGDSSSANLAVACLKCNRSRGARIGIRQLEKLFELRQALDN